MTHITRQVREIAHQSEIKVGITSESVRRTSCSLHVSGNTDPDVGEDLETLARRWAPDRDHDYLHNSEGNDDGHRLNSTKFELAYPRAWQDS